uniref:Uncharacterized protein n=1 Tax=viral metagenome TaxID=1070528 RepID=A0A6C0JKT7_9ZZZZ
MYHNSTNICKYCNRGYKQKFNLDRHVQTCEFLSKSKREQDNEIDSYEKLPTQKEMFLLIQELSLRIGKIEKENADLKNSVRVKIKRNFNDILNESSKPDISYNEFIELLLNSVENYLDIVFNTNLLKGIYDLFTHFIEKYDDKLPIRSYDVKPNKFYIYDTNKKWVLLSNSDIDHLIASISYRFLVEFNRCWYLVNKDKIENEETYKIMYMNYYLKILGGDRMNDEKRNTQVRSFIYNKLKRNIRSQCLEINS